MSSGLRMTEDQVAEHVCRVRGGIRHESSASREYYDGTEPPTKPRIRNTLPIPTEHEEQVAFVTWFRHTYPGVRIAAIPNGQERHPLIAKKLRDEGVSPGFPDLTVPEWDLYIEMKRTAGGRVSDDQKEWIAYLTGKCGKTCLVCHGAEDAVCQVREFVRSRSKL